MAVVLIVTLPKFTDVEESTGGSVPVPLNATVNCGLTVALSLMVSVPVCAPGVAGSKARPMVHAVAAASELPQAVPAVGATISKPALATTEVKLRGIA